MENFGPLKCDRLIMFSKYTEVFLKDSKSELCSPIVHICLCMYAHIISC